MTSRKNISDARIELARLSLRGFISLIFPNYTFTFAHEQIIETIENVILGYQNKAIIAVPPQIGKSTIISKIAPVWAAGINIDEMIAGISYSVKLAGEFNLEAQQYYNSDTYRLIFPNNYSKAIQPNTSVKTGVKARQKGDFFNFVDAKKRNRGYYASFGIGGGITGRSASLILLDDTIKNIDDAYSPARREKNWQIFTSSIQTRVTNNSRIIATATPWHKDDIMGRIMQLPDADLWEKVYIPALKQNKPVTIENDVWKFELSELYNKDPREVGESIWEEKRPKAQLELIKETDPFVFQAMYQVQPPNARNGGQMFFYALANREYLFKDIEKPRGGTYVVSFDNNLDPVAAVVCHVTFGGTAQSTKLTVLKEYECGYPRTDSKKVGYKQSETPIEDICAQIKKEFGATSYIITGDSALNNRAHGMRGSNPAKIIKANLIGKDAIPIKNEGIANSLMLCNYVISLGSVAISSQCPKLWEELNAAQTNENKELVKDSKNALNIADCFRYALHYTYSKLYDVRHTK